MILPGRGFTGGCKEQRGRARGDGVRKCPVAVSCDEKRQSSCRACKLAWRITDTQPCYIAQVSRRGSCSARKNTFPAPTLMENKQHGRLSVIERGSKLQERVSPSQLSEALAPDWMMDGLCDHMISCPRPAWTAAATFRSHARPSVKSLFVFQGTWFVWLVSQWMTRNDAVKYTQSARCCKYCVIAWWPGQRPSRMFWKCWFHRLVFNAEYGLHSREEKEKKKKREAPLWLN